MLSLGAGSCTGDGNGGKLSRILGGGRLGVGKLGINTRVMHTHASNPNYANFYWLQDPSLLSPTRTFTFLLRFSREPIPLKKLAPNRACKRFSGLYHRPNNSATVRLRPLTLYVDPNVHRFFTHTCSEPSFLNKAELSGHRGLTFHRRQHLHNKAVLNPLDKIDLELETVAGHGGPAKP